LFYVWHAHPGGVFATIGNRGPKHNKQPLCNDSQSESEDVFVRKLICHWSLVVGIDKQAWSLCVCVSVCLSVCVCGLHVSAGGLSVYAFRAVVLV